MTELKIEDLYVFKRNHGDCRLCKGAGQLLFLEGKWKNPRPCPVCRGVGQMREDQMPSGEQMVDMVLNYGKQ